MRNKIKREARRFAEFGIVGAVVALLSFAQLWLFIDVWGLNYWLAYVIQTIVSVELNYIGNYFLAWRDRRHEVSLVRSHITFWATRGFLIFINPFIFAALAAAGMNYFWAQVVIIGANTLINYATSDKLVFNAKKLYKTEGKANV